MCSLSTATQTEGTILWTSIMSEREELLPQVPETRVRSGSRLGERDADKVCPNCVSFKKRLSRINDWCYTCDPPKDARMYSHRICECGREFKTELNPGTLSPKNKRCPHCSHNRT